MHPPPVPVETVVDDVPLVLPVVALVVAVEVTVVPVVPDIPDVVPPVPEEEESPQPNAVTSTAHETHVIIKKARMVTT